MVGQIVKKVRSKEIVVVYVILWQFMDVYGILRVFTMFDGENDQNGWK